jgi:LCP family protein required for cell wall assembly
MKQQEHPTIEFRGLRERRRSPLRRALKVVLILGVIFGMLLAGTVVYLKFYVSGKIDATHIPVAVDPCPENEACNVLVLGSDARNVVEASQRGSRQFKGGGGKRADTILLIHVPADGKSAVVVSFPRDLRVRIPGKSGFSKINAAYGGDKTRDKSGAQLMVDTVKAFSGLKVHHYVEINFAAFQKIVDAVGGVRLCPKKAYNDPQSGLILKKAGCQTFDGELALGYVRMRKQDPLGDFGRIDRQQEFMRVLMQKVKSIGFLLDIPRLIKTVNAVSEGVQTDRNLGEGELRGIANKLAGFKQSNVDFRVVPSVSKYIGGVSYVVHNTAQTKALFKALRDDTALPPYGKTGASIPQPEDVSMVVLNGTTTSGLAATVRDELRALGYKVRETGNAPRRDYRTTVILFEPGAEAKAQLVAEEFPGAKVQEATESQDTDIVVILGSDQASRASPSPSS